MSFSPVLKRSPNASATPITIVIPFPRRCSSPRCTSRPGSGPVPGPSSPPGWGGGPACKRSVKTGVPLSRSGGVSPILEGTGPGCPWPEDRRSWKERSRGHQATLCAMPAVQIRACHLRRTRRQGGNEGLHPLAVPEVQMVGRLPRRSNHDPEPSAFHPVSRGVMRRLPAT